MSTQHFMYKADTKYSRIPRVGGILRLKAEPEGRPVPANLGMPVAIGMMFCNITSKQMNGKKYAWFLHGLDSCLRAGRIKSIIGHNAKTFCSIKNIPTYTIRLNPKFSGNHW